MKRGMKILIAFDSKEQSKRAIDYGVSLAQYTKSELIVLSVIPEIMLPVLIDEVFGAIPVTIAQDITEYQKKMKINYEKRLDEVNKDITNSYPELKVNTKLFEGRASSIIVKQAKNEKVDLIIIGVGSSKISDWLWGSTSHRMIDSCSIPILIIK
jgi:nucleotide-binding universal stress UspA family protein